MKDITGNKYNKLTAIKYLGKEKWLFNCECGKKVTKFAGDVKRNKIKSCSKKCTTGNPSKHPLYQIWDGIKKRCYNKNATGYERYGGSNIFMCHKWYDSFWNFVEDIGVRPSLNHTIERLNNNLGYSKDNCKWATKKEQAVNRKTTLLIEYNKTKYSFSDICKKLGLNYQKTYYKLKKSGLTAQEYFNKNIF